MRFIKNAAHFAGIFAIGSAGYGLCETAVRGRTHWSMLLAGGICLVWLVLADIKYMPLPIYLRSLYGGLIITAVEFVFGCIFNIILGFEVWDYSHLPLNIMGQICPKFYFIWVLMSFAVFVCRKKLLVLYQNENTAG